MYAILLFTTLVFAAGSAAACPTTNAHSATNAAPATNAYHARTPHPADFQTGGSVVLKPRPLPGTVFPMPSLTSPIRGPHGGLVA